MLMKCRIPNRVKQKKMGKRCNFYERKVNRYILLFFFLLFSILVYADSEVSNTNQGISNASPGDYIIRSDGQKVVLTQADIDYARRQLGITTIEQDNQDVLPSPNDSSSNHFFSIWFEEIRNVFKDPGSLFRGILKQINGFINILPFFVWAIFYILLFLAAIGILLSHLLGIYKYRLEWEPNPNSNLMLSYFCGSGQSQLKKTYREAHSLLRDKTWLRFSVARLAFILGNITHASKLLMFAYSLLYLPMAILGGVEMTVRIIIGTVWLLFTAFIHWIILLVLKLISFIMIPLWQIIDKTLRVEQHCPYCYNQFDLPKFKCPYCGIIHEQLIPSRCGILVAKCKCGHFLSSSAFTGRSYLDAVCPKCDVTLVAANAKQFSVLLFGGNTSGKTAFLAAFQHLYLDKKFRPKKLSIYGEPHNNFDKLDEMYKNGITEPSSASKILAYNFIHKIGRNAKHNLIVYDIPDEVILNGAFERNPVHFGYSGGIIVIVDPLSISSVRNECLKGGDAKAVENYSQDDVDTIIVQFIQQFSGIVGRSAGKINAIPVAVLITKADIKVVIQEIGLPVIKSKFNANPDSYGKNIVTARNKICREYLLNLGLTNAINNLESVFSNVNYFPVSAIGHLSKAGKAYEPFGVLEPIAWIVKGRNAGINQMLRAKL